MLARRPSGPAAASRDPGEALHAARCGTCHLAPAPGELDRATWRDRTLPWMRVLVGLDPPKVTDPSGFTPPSSPLISRADFEVIERWILSRAPEVLDPGPRPTLSRWERFTAVRPAAREGQPQVTLVVADAARHRVLAGYSVRQGLDVFGLDGARTATIGGAGPAPVAAEETPLGLCTTAIGYLYPSNVAAGEVRCGARRLVAELVRPVHTTFADLDGDGVLDLAVSSFGKDRGGLFWYPGPAYPERALIEKPGALGTIARDLDGDGDLDLLALLAQADERAVALIQTAPGVFEEHTLFARSPLYGHTHLELADLDGDGRDDLLVTSGDNGEYPSPAKPYHGVRVYLARGGLHFEEAFFFPQHGATKAIARDLDGDGDLDIASIAHWADFARAPGESLVILENRGGMRFVPYTVPEAIEGRWLALDGADLDGDGAIDLVVGANLDAPAAGVPRPLLDRWRREGPSFLFLRGRPR